MSAENANNTYEKEPYPQLTEEELRKLAHPTLQEVKDDPTLLYFSGD